MSTSEKKYTIQQISLKLGIPKSTIRFWEKEFGAVLTPDRTPGGQRRYTEAHAIVLKRVRNMRADGIPLADIKRDFKKDRADMDEPNPGDMIEPLANRIAEMVKKEVISYLEDNIPAIEE